MNRLTHVTFRGRAEPWGLPRLYPSRGWTATASMPDSGGSHPLADDAVSVALRRRAEEIDAAFSAIEPTLRGLAPQQFEESFPLRASAVLRERLGVALAPETLTANWAAPLDMGRLYARCVLGVFRRLVERAFDRDLARLSDGENAEELIRRWGFHALDITPCADGRLSGVVDYILRLPPAVVAYRNSYAGAMFDVAESLRQWENVELRRWREGRPNTAETATRYLKIGVYHFSSDDPGHQGCAAHGGDDGRAAGALLQRLGEFEQAVAQTHGAAGSAAILLVGVDTDTDSIRVHVPDASGTMTVARYLDSLSLYDLTGGLARIAAKEAIRDAVAACAGVAADDPRTEGMRWLCGYLLKNNLGQVDAVRAWNGGPYKDRGHTERLIVVGDAIDDVQLRNLAFQAQMETVEEGAADLDIGVGILRGLNETRGLATPVLAHFRYDPRIPGAFQRAERRARRLRAAILSTHAGLAASGRLHVEAVVRGGDGAALLPVEGDGAAQMEAQA